MRRKYEIPLHAFFDHTGISRHLEKRAKQGWMLEHIRTNSFFRYRRCEPQNLRFAVTYFPTASDFAAPDEDQQAFYDLCAAAGWKFVAQTFQMQIFCNEDPDAVPLETDPAVQLENIHNALWRNYMGGKFALLAVVLMMLFNIGSKLEASVFSTMRSSLTLLTSALILLLVPHQALEVAAYYRWRKKALRAAEEENRFLPVPGGRVRETIFLTLYALLIAAIIVEIPPSAGLIFFFGVASFLLILQLVFFLRDFLKKKGISVTWNYFFSILLIVALTCGRTAVTFYLNEHTRPQQDIGVSADTLPLTAELLGQQEESTSAYYEEVGSPLASTVNAGQLFRSGSQAAPRVFFYFLHRSPSEWILSHSARWQIRYLGYEFLADLPTADQRIDPAPFGAKEAWIRIHNGNHEYLLRYDECVIQLSFYWEPSAHQVQTAAQTLLQWQ